MKLKYKPFYTPADIKNLVYEHHLGDPGSYPYTRGKYPEMYRRKVWIQRTLTGEGSPSKTNKILKELLAQGATAIDVVTDNPTWACLDSDHPLAEFSVGTSGVPLCTLDDFRELFDGIPIDKISISFSTFNHPFVIAALSLIAEERGIAPSMLRGSITPELTYTDLMTYDAKVPIEMRLRLQVDTIRYCVKEMPKFYPLYIDTYFIAEALLDVVDEIALGIMSAKLIINETLKRGLNIDDFGPRIGWLASCHMDFFAEIAKFRALRRIWARMMREEYGAKNPKSMALTITCHTSGIELTAQQPILNIVRGTIQALAAILGGVQAVEISCFDEPFRIPTREAAIISLRTQQIIEHEARIFEVADPLGGSYFIESLVNEIEQAVYNRLEEFKRAGDMLKLLKTGYFKNLFDDHLLKRQQLIESGELKKVGVNIFNVTPEEDFMYKWIEGLTKELPKPCLEQIEKTKKLKRARDLSKLRAALRRLYYAAQDENENIVYPIKDALKAGATIQEITGVIRLAYNEPYDPFGNAEPPVNIP
jgi:methylmalonyl-CoA mutase N-terminal domain/subunit